MVPDIELIKTFLRL